MRKLPNPPPRIPSAQTSPLPKPPPTHPTSTSIHPQHTPPHLHLPTLTYPFVYNFSEKPQRKSCREWETRVRDRWLIVTWWDLLSMFALLYTAIVAPLQVGFYVRANPANW